MSSKHPKKAGRIDLVDVIVTSAKDTLAHKDTLLRLAVFPVMVKLFALCIVVAFGLQDNTLRQGLVFIPAYFVEGWFVAVAIRMVMFKEQWPFFLTGDAQQDLTLLRRRRTAIQASGILYTLFRLISVVFVSFMLTQAAFQDAGVATQGVSPDTVPQIADQTASLPFFVSFIAAMLALFATLWSYRYFCMYVPAAMGVPIKTYLKACFGLGSSLQFLFVTFFCFIPVFIVFSFLHSFAASFFPGAELTAEFWLYSGVFALIQSVMEVIITLFTGVALAYTLSEILKKKA